MFELKPIHKEAAQAALERAQRYRLLNEPIEAESICRDILEIEPENQEALATLVLALTDQFEIRLGDAYRETREALPRFADEYSRVYYEGIVCERRAKAHFKRGGPEAPHMAYDWFKRAMDLYEKAEPLRKPGNDESILRWNTCARILNRHPEIRPAPHERTETMLE